MNLSRAAKKYRAEVPPVPTAPKPVKEKKNNKKAQKPATQSPPEPVAEVVPPVDVVAEEVAAPPVEPIPEPVVPAETPEPTSPPPTKQWPVKAKRPRFVFVREKVEKKEQTAAALPPRSTKLAARMLTQNLALVPKEDAPKLPR